MAGLRSRFSSFFLVAICATGCISPEDLEHQLVGNWYGEGSESRWCITFGEDKRVRYVEQKRSELSQGDVDTTIRFGSWSVQDGGRFTLKLDTAMRDSVAESAAVDIDVGDSKAREVVERTSLRYYLKGFESDRLRYTQQVMGGNYLGDFAAARVETCNKLPQFRVGL